MSLAHVNTMTAFSTSFHKEFFHLRDKIADEGVWPFAASAFFDAKGPIERSFSQTALPTPEERSFDTIARERIPFTEEMSTSEPESKSTVKREQNHDKSREVEFLVPPIMSLKRRTNSYQRSSKKSRNSNERETPDHHNTPKASYQKECSNASLKSPLQLVNVHKLAIFLREVTRCIVCQHASCLYITGRVSGGPPALLTHIKITCQHCNYQTTHQLTAPPNAENETSLTKSQLEDNHKKSCPEYLSVSKSETKTIETLPTSCCNVQLKNNTAMQHLGIITNSIDTLSKLESNQETYENKLRPSSPFKIVWFKYSKQNKTMDMEDIFDKNSINSQLISIGDKQSPVLQEGACSESTRKSDTTTDYPKVILLQEKKPEQAELKVLHQKLSSLITKQIMGSLLICNTNTDLQDIQSQSLFRTGSTKEPLIMKSSILGNLNSNLPNVKEKGFSKLCDVQKLTATKDSNSESSNCILLNEENVSTELTPNEENVNDKKKGFEKSNYNGNTAVSSEDCKKQLNYNSEKIKNIKKARPALETVFSREPRITRSFSTFYNNALSTASTSQSYSDTSSDQRSTCSSTSKKKEHFVQSNKTSVSREAIAPTAIVPPVLSVWLPHTGSVSSNAAKPHSECSNVSYLKTQHLLNENEANQPLQNFVNNVKQNITKTNIVDVPSEVVDAAENMSFSSVTPIKYVIPQPTVHIPNILTTSVPINADTFEKSSELSPENSNLEQSIFKPLLIRETSNVSKVATIDCRNAELITELLKPEESKNESGNFQDSIFSKLKNFYEFHSAMSTLLRPTMVEKLPSVSEKTSLTEELENAKKLYSIIFNTNVNINETLIDKDCSSINYLFSLVKCLTFPNSSKLVSRLMLLLKQRFNRAVLNVSLKRRKNATKTKSLVKVIRKLQRSHKKAAGKSSNSEKNEFTDARSKQALFKTKCFGSVSSQQLRAFQEAICSIYLKEMSLVDDKLKFIKKINLPVYLKALRAVDGTNNQNVHSTHFGNPGTSSESLKNEAI